MTSKPDHSKLFYWLVHNRNSSHYDNAHDIPLVLWMNGGPGCSSMIGMMVEHGPYKIKHDIYGSSGDTVVLEKNAYCWCNTAHMLYVDQPIGVGLSFLSGRDNTTDIPTTQLDVAAQMYYALQQFYDLYPELLNNPLYLAGESYAGKYIPWLANFIIERNKYHSSQIRSLPLAGVLIGNGMVDPLTQRFAYKPVMAANGFFDQYQMEVMTALEQWCRRDLMLANYTSAANTCFNLQKYMQAISGDLNLFDYRQYFGSYNNTALLWWLNHNDTRRALGVPNHHAQLIAQCDHDVHVALQGEFLKSVKNLVANLFLEIRVLLYNGLFDLKDGPLSTETYMNTINWHGRIGLFNAERYVLRVNKDSPNDIIGTHIMNDVNINGVLGYCKTYENVSMCTVAEAGHLTPLNNPQAMYTIVDKFLTHSQMCTINNQTNTCTSYGERVCEFLTCRHGVCRPSEGGECVCYKGYSGVDCGTSVTDLDQMENMIADNDINNDMSSGKQMNNRKSHWWQRDTNDNNGNDQSKYYNNESDGDEDNTAEASDGGDTSVRTTSHSGVEIRHDVYVTLPAQEKSMYYFHHNPSEYDATYYLAASLIELNTVGELWLELSYAEDDRVARMIERNREKHELYQYLAQRADHDESKTHVSRAHEHEHMITARLAKGYYVLTINGRNINSSIDARLVMSITSGSSIDVSTPQYRTPTVYSESTTDNTINIDKLHRTGWILPTTISVMVLIVVFSGYLYYRYHLNKRSDYSLIDDTPLLSERYTSPRRTTFK